MEISNRQLEKNVSASFGYVKKDMLMLNDAFSDLHEKIQHLSINNATLLEEISKLRKELSKQNKKKTSTVKKVAVKKKNGKKREDLTRIEGIGPAIKKLLWNKGIDTYKKLGNKTPKDLREILEKAGTKYQMHNPNTWPRQAKLADKKEWETLKKLQEKLNAGQFENKNAKKTTKKTKKGIKKVVKTETIYE